MKVGFKLTGVFLIFTISITVLFYLIGLRNQNKNFERIALEHIKNVNASFHNLEERDTKMLFTVLEAVVRDPRLKEIYMGKNREKLYSHGQPLFKNLKEKYGISQFYFILPDGRVFLRMHEKDIHGDRIRRISFQKARDTGRQAWEFEIGKSAFALRAVMPYYDAGRLIGYVELGEGIDHFLKILKGGTHSEFGMVADKVHLNREDWQTIRKTAGLRDNWDDMEGHLILGSTTEGEMAAKCFVKKNLERLEKGESVLDQMRGGNKTFVCGGFDLKDSGGRHIGAVLSLTDITEYVAAAKKANSSMLLTAIIFFFITFAAGSLVSRNITRPILRLSEVAKEVGRGDLNQRINVGSNDEIGQLGRVFNDMVIRRKETEDALQKSEERLREQFQVLQDTLATVSRSQKEWQDTFDSITDLISIQDKECNIIKANKAMAANFGLHPRDIRGRKCYDLFHGSDSSVEGCPNKITLAEGKPSTGEVRAPGMDKIFRVSTFPYFSPEGKELVGSIHVARDITEEKEKEKRLAVSEKLAALGQLASGVAHEVRNPLHALLSVTEALMQELEGEHQLDEYLFHIRAQVERLSSLMTGLLAMGKPMEPSSLRVESLPGICLAALDLWKQSSLSKEHKVGIVKSHADNIFVMADGKKMEQVFLNLLDNAAQHSPGGSEIRIVIDEPSSNMVKVHVVDEGSGLPEEILPKAFEPFFTTRKEGVGLGLSIVRNIIEMHGGTVMIRNNAPLPGCTVEISLPLAVSG